MDEGRIKPSVFQHVNEDYSVFGGGINQYEWEAPLDGETPAELYFGIEGSIM